MAIDKSGAQEGAAHPTRGLIHDAWVVCAPMCRVRSGFERTDGRHKGYNYFMPEYRRIFHPGGTYFLTLVTYKRQNIFSISKTVALLHESIEHVICLHPFKIVAFVFLPDHLHFIWRLPEGDANYSTRISQIKRRFSKQYIAIFGAQLKKSASQDKRRELTIWQRRFWEHWICDEEDLNQHIDYIHYNPVKHGLVDRVCEWKVSSFHDYVKAGFYDSSWGQGFHVDEKKYTFGE
jgi:putative transposase